MQTQIARSRLESEKPDILLIPEVGKIGILEFDQSKEAIKAGHACVREQTDALKALLTDPDVRVRSGAVALLPVYQKDVGADALESLLRDHAPLFEGVAPQGITTDAIIDHVVEQVPTTA